MTEQFETIIMFKPDARYIIFRGLRRERLLHEVAAGLLVAAGLEIVQYSQKELRQSEVRAIYANVLRENPQDDAIWGVAWKEQVVDHISSGTVDSYLLGATDSSRLDVARDIKNWLRAHYNRGDDVVRNIAHVPDPDEFIITKEILFNE